MTAPNYGKAFELWRTAANDSWQRYTHHAFVQGLGDGSLPHESFLHYLRQDYVFLIHFSRAWALAAAKAETLEELQAAASTVHALVHIEMPLHVEICAAAGISRDELEATPERKENLAYTRYVLESGYSGDFLDLMAALAPCVLGYGEIGLRLAASCADNTPYRSWIETYAGDEFQNACREAGALIDSALHRRMGADWESQPRWRQLCGRFRTATELEEGFWQMGLTPNL